MGDTLKNVGSFVAAFAFSYAVTTLVENAKNNTNSVDMYDNNTRINGLNNFSNSTALRPNGNTRMYF